MIINVDTTERSVESTKEKIHSNIGNSETSVWKEYGNNYENVGVSSAKKELDNDIAIKILELGNCSTSPTTVGEFGCGPAPISSRLLSFNKAWGRPLFKVEGFDNDANMSNNIPQNENFKFNKLDISDPYAYEKHINNGGNKIDIAILENSWYAVTTGVSEETDEALYRRFVVLQNIWSLLDRDGFLIITDPNDSTKDLNFKNTLQGASREISTAIKRGELRESINNIKDPRTKEIIDKNKNEILPSSQLFTHTEMLDFIINTGLFQIEHARSGKYMGHNTNIVVQKRNTDQISFKPFTTFLLDIRKSKAKYLLEDFRRLNYSEKVNPIVTGIDEQDDKHKESYTVVSQLSGTIIPGAIATVDIEEDYEEDSWEFSQLFNIPEETLIEIIPQGKKKTAEIRRLGTISAYDKNFERAGVYSTIDVITRIYEEIKERDVDILFFTATPDRLSHFNGILRKLNLGTFTEVPDAKLNRINNTNLKVLLTGARYFFEDTGWNNIINNETLTSLREYLIEHKDMNIEQACFKLWGSKQQEKLEEVRILLTNTDLFPENAHLYYAQVPK
ncbi:MAG: hypothetical protein PHP08_02520 [Candidatus Dojkabacteria bacterium]|nr:hypothetical protein [Candidatus Dojkabacteria bacterium]